jgi:hypothetical protein
VTTIAVLALALATSMLGVLRLTRTGTSITLGR